MSYRRILLLISFFILMFLVGIFTYFFTTKPYINSTTTPIKTITVLQNKVPPTPTPTPTVIYPVPTPYPQKIQEPQQKTNSSPKEKSDIFYTVASGETLSEIANKFNLSVSDLVTVNHLLDPNFIIAGQKLLIGTEPINTPVPNTNGKQIIVILSKQTTYVYENGELQKTFLISSGVANHPAVIGNFQIQTKLELTRMTGPDYDLANVPWVMYFYQGYSFHGTYWHNNFGTPMSHGCINMYTPDAEWLFNWAPVGTPVQIIP